MLIRGSEAPVLILKVILVLFMLSCVRDNDEFSPTIQIVSPSDGDTIFASHVNVRVDIGGFDLETDQHAVFYRLNEEDEAAIDATDFTIAGLAGGVNTIRVDMKRGTDVLDTDEISIFVVPSFDVDSVVVKNGTGSGLYKAGTTVEVAANTREIPYVFDYWKGDTEWLIDSTFSPAFFTMPEQPVRLEAVHKVDSAYYKNLNVTYGTGSGKYLPGETVQVNLLMNDPLDFTHWSGGNDFLDDDSLSTSLSFAMPDRDVDLMGRWEVLNVSFSTHLYPIIEKQCNEAGCHGQNGAPAYLSHSAIAADGQNIVNKTRSGNMPPPSYGQLTDEELEIIRVWVEEGMLDN